VPANAQPAQPTIGYLARMSPEKGLRVLVDAFKIIRANNKVQNAKLRIGGSVTANDQQFVSEIQAQLQRDNLLQHVEFKPNLSREEKIAFLQSLSVLSVPASYGESFGLYIIEALACGVPVVQPRHGAFPEILDQTGGGILCEPNSAAELAEKFEELLLDPKRAMELGRSGREKVLQNYNIGRVANDIAKLFEKAAGV
jgi:glycosyltransferase involved in cell wall biosynthesis